MQDSGIQVLFQGNNLLRILQGLGVTIGISILSVLLSMMFGTVMGIIMTSHSRIVRFLTRLYLEFIRIMPQLVLLFIVYFGLARNFNINISGETSAIIVFTLWGTAEMGDLVRGTITSLPKHQFESGQALRLDQCSTLLPHHHPTGLEKIATTSHQPCHSDDQNHFLGCLDWGS